MSYLLSGARIWDGIADAPIPQEVAVEGGQIVEHAAAAAERIDLAGLTLIPGLIDAHAHLCLDGTAESRTVFESDSPEQMLLRMAAAARRMVEAGITTVRELGSPTGLAVALRDSARAGLVVAPDLLVAGAPVTVTGGHCWFMGGEADGVEGVRLAVRERHRAGVDWIKVMASGGNLTPGSNPVRASYSVEELRALTDEAHRVGLRVTAHAHGVEGVQTAVAGGVDGIEHCSFQTEDGYTEDAETIAEIARLGIVVSPTITGTVIQGEGSERWRQRSALLRSFLDAGCRMLMSTDCGVTATPHDGLAPAMAMLQKMTGLSALDVLRLATSTSADLLGLPDRGVLMPGKRADLLAVEGDPTADLGALARVRLVVRGGEVVVRRGV